jgi:iron(III) transport system substrate-binding protein
MTERRAGKYLWDVIMAGGATIYLFYKANAVEPIAPTFILPEVIDESRWWKKRHDYFELERKYILNFNMAPLPFVAYNNQLVKPGEIKSYRDLLNPKWKGKIVAVDPTLGPRVDLHLAFLYSHPELGPDFLRRLLSETNMITSRDTRQVVDWLAGGRYALSLFASLTAADLDVAKGQGLPIGWFGPRDLKEGVSISPSNGSVGLLSRAPHPNAAKIAINWLLSREGQMLYQKLQNGANSLREDIPKDNLQPYLTRSADASYTEPFSPERTDMDALRKLVNESLKKN